MVTRYGVQLVTWDEDENGVPTGGGVTQWQPITAEAYWRVYGAICAEAGEPTGEAVLPDVSAFIHANPGVNVRDVAREVVTRMTLVTRDDPSTTGDAPHDEV